MRTGDPTSSRDPPPVTRSLFESLDDDAARICLGYCSMRMLRMLTGVSREWAQRVRIMLGSKVLADHSLAIDRELSWSELGWLLRTLRRGGVRVERLRGAEATISFAPLLCARRACLGACAGVPIRPLQEP